MSNSAPISPGVSEFLGRQHELFIGGEFQAADDAQSLKTENPATGETLSRLTAGSSDDVDRAVQAATTAFYAGEWSRMAPAARADLLLRLADAIEQQASEIALIETLDNGMPLAGAKDRAITGAVAGLRYFAGWATKLTGETTTPSAPGDWLAYTLREPVGVAGLIVPWNSPLIMFVNKLAAALAAGCTVVAKPSELTSLSALRIAELVREVGFPPGVVNVVTGLGSTVGQAMIEHPMIDKISFTGSTKVGKQILQASAGNLKRVSLELGGKSPTFIFADADLEKAISAAAMGIFGHTGQVCAAGSRLYVEDSVFDEVVSGISDVAKSLNVGDGSLPSTDIGPVISSTQRRRVLDYIDSGLTDGAELLVGGKAMDGHGYFLEPTVFVETNSSMRIVREEIFGPVLCASSFIGDFDLNELARVGNETVYGLNAAVWTRDISRAHRLAKLLRSGTVRINSQIGIDYSLPFGGYKQSGIGRENGRVGVEAYTELKSVFVSL